MLDVISVQEVHSLSMSITKSVEILKTIEILYDVTSKHNGIFYYFNVNVYVALLFNLSHFPFGFTFVSTICMYYLQMWKFYIDCGITFNPTRELNLYVSKYKNPGALSRRECPQTD